MIHTLSISNKCAIFHRYRGVIYYSWSQFRKFRQSPHLLSSFTTAWMWLQFLHRIHISARSFHHTGFRRRNIFIAILSSFDFCCKLIAFVFSSNKLWRHVDTHNNLSVYIWQLPRKIWSPSFDQSNCRFDAESCCNTRWKLNSYWKRMLPLFLWHNVIMQLSKRCTGLMLIK